MKNICLIGAGNIGSRHLQALKKVSFPLNIEVVDPSLDSLNIARERYEQIKSEIPHKTSFLNDLNQLKKEIDLAIIATSSNVRRKVIDELLNKSQVKYLILEKILFQKDKDYLEVEKLLKRKKVKTWINFSMRTMPFYKRLKGKFEGPIQMIVSGSQYGLITNVIHFIDYLAYLTNIYEFEVSTLGLDKKIIKSKRPGFLELNGTLNIALKDGSFGSFTCYSSGDAPFIIEINSKNYHVISKESERKAYISSRKDKWNWEEVKSDIPYQSEMTNSVAEDIFKKGGCILTPYKEASKLHLQLLEELLKFLNKSGKKFNFYPFT